LAAARDQHRDAGHMAAFNLVLHHRRQALEPGGCEPEFFRSRDRLNLQAKMFVHDRSGVSGRVGQNPALLPIIRQWRVRTRQPCGVSPANPRLNSLECRGREMIEQRQRDQKHDPHAEAPASQLLLDRQQRLALRAIQLLLNSGLSHICPPIQSMPAVRLCVQPLARERRRDAAKEDPGDQETDPDDEAEQAENVDSSELAEAFLPYRLEVRQNADGEEGQDKKMTRNVLASPIAAGTFLAMSAGVPRARKSPAAKVITKPMMNFGKRCQISLALALS